MSTGDPPAPPQGRRRTPTDGHVRKRPRPPSSSLPARRRCGEWWPPSETSHTPSSTSRSRTPTIPSVTKAGTVSSATSNSLLSNGSPPIPGRPAGKVLEEPTAFGSSCNKGSSSAGGAALVCMGDLGRWCLQEISGGCWSGNGRILVRWAPAGPCLRCAGNLFVGVGDDGTTCGSVFPRWPAVSSAGSAWLRLARPCSPGPPKAAARPPTSGSGPVTPPNSCMVKVSCGAGGALGVIVREEDLP